mgnify:CR=1 FL=1
MSCTHSVHPLRAPLRGLALALSLCGLMLPTTASAQTTAPARRTARARMLGDSDTAPVVDGKVDDAIWKTVTPFDHFIQQDPQQGAPATEDTEVRVVFSKTHLYVSFVCIDSDPSKIIVSQARRDSSLTDTDSVIMVLDTFNDSQNAFVFGTNPIGIEYDGQVAMEGQTSGIAAAGAGGGGVQRGNISAFNPNWDGDWNVKASVTARGWEAEMAIPLKTLRYATGINVEQYETNRTEFNSRGFQIMLTQIDGVGMTNDWGTVVGQEDTYLFERIELIRGANGLLTGVGNASGTINYVRKRPTNKDGGEVIATAGSYDLGRLALDYNKVFTADGSWAGRLVVAHEDKD